MKSTFGPAAWVLTLLLLWNPPSPSAECTRESQTRPTVGLVLSGGGARGQAHIGVLKVLEAMRIPVDVVTGTSMGSIVGGLYSAGMRPEEIEDVILSVRWDDMFTDDSSRTERTFRRKRDDDLDFFGPRLGYRDGEFVLPEAALVGQKVGLLFQRLTLSHTTEQDFDRLPIPFRAVAADIVTGEEVILDSGNLARAMQASMSIPGIFAPVADGDRLLVDGGIVNNLPIQVARSMGADVVIAVDVSYPLYPRDRLENAIAVIGQLTNLLVYRATQDQVKHMRPQDILIQPPLGEDFGSTDFAAYEKAVPLGAAGTIAHRQALERLSIPEAQYQEYRAGLRACDSPRPRLEFVKLENRSSYADDVILDRLNVRAGQPLDFDQIERDVSSIYGLGHLREVRYELVDDGPRQGIVLHVTDDHRAPNLVEYGLNFFSNGRNNAFNLRLGFLRTGIDRVGGEWRTVAQMGEEPGLFTELYKPLRAGSPYFFNPRLTVERARFGLFEGEDPQAQIFVDSAELELTLGKEFGKSAEMAMGIRTGAARAEVNIGDPELVDLNIGTGESFLRLRYDHLDDLFFPNSGGFGSAEFSVASTSLGAEQSFEQLQLEYYYNFNPAPRHHLLLGGRFDTTLDDDAPINGLFRAGGFGQLSGLEFNQVEGQHFALLVGGYRYEVGRTGFLPAYLGGTLELGNAWDRRSDIDLDSALLQGSLYFGYRSPIGPLYMGVGLGESSDGTFFIRLGDLFVSD